MIGCDCEVCRSEDPRDKRTRASVYLETPDRKILIDAGPDLRTQCLRENISEVDAVLFTHEHSDHIVGFDDLRRFSVGAEDTLPIWATESCLKRLIDSFRYAFDKSNWYPGYLKPVANLIEGPFKVGDSRFTPLEVQHGKVRTVGFLLERSGRKILAYLPDCKIVLKHSLEAMMGVECLIIDCLRNFEHPTHMSYEETMRVREIVKPGKTWLTHISDRLGHAEFEAELPEGVKIAYDGLKLSF